MKMVQSWLEGLLVCADCCMARACSADARFPSRGVTISYEGGSSEGCWVDGLPQQRSINIKLKCSPDADQSHIGDNELVVERQQCVYDLYLESLYGCPTRESCTTLAKAQTVHR